MGQRQLRPGIVKFENMIFVTGGTGLVGAHLLFELVKSGKKVRALKRETSNISQVLKTFSYYSKNPNELFERIEWVNGDILDHNSLNGVLAGITEIYHCAAIVSFQSKERKKMIANNVEGTANLVNAAIWNGVTKICHVSSISALGSSKNGEPVTEETNWIPSKKVSGYSESKFFSEMEIWRGIEEGMDAIIINPSIIFGPANWETSSSKMFKTIYDGMQFYTKGITGFVDVNDVVDAMITLMEKQNFEKCKNQRFILNAENLSFQSVFYQIADALDKSRPRYYISNFLLGIVWRIAALWSWIVQKPPLISKDTVANSNAVINFDGNKITRYIDFQYQAISDSIIQTARFLKQDKLDQN